MPATVRFYEVVYIIPPDRSDEQIQATVDKYTNLITTQGGVLERTDIWERRRLAYEIKGFTEGIYVVATFRGLPKVEAELKRVFRISEDTLRSIVIRPDDETVALESAASARAFRPQAERDAAAAAAALASASHTAAPTPITLDDVPSQAPAEEPASDEAPAAEAETDQAPTEEIAVAAA